MAVTRGALLLAAALAALAVPTAGAEDPALTTQGACASPLHMAPDSASVAGPAPSAAPSTRIADAAPDLAGGRWTRMARAPFGSEYEPVAWTGRRLVALDNDSGRTAVYAPSRDRWREVARAPRRFDSTARSTWTGSELVVMQMSQDGRIIAGAAYHPGRDRWRRIAPLVTRSVPDTGDDATSDHALVEPVWSGAHVIVADSLGLLVAYDPAADCWLELGKVPGEPFVWRLYVAGATLLVESRRFDEPVEIRAFDPVTRAWSEPIVGPLDMEASEDGGTWVDGRLAYITWYARDDETAGSNAVFDPSTQTWNAFQHDCLSPASGTVAAGTLLVAADGRRAIDGRTLECIELPRPPRRLDGTERKVWTGTVLLAWSGLREGPALPRRGGLRFTPTDPIDG